MKIFHKKNQESSFLVLIFNYSVIHSDVNHAAIRTRPIENIISIINTPNNQFIIMFNYI